MVIVVVAMVVVMVFCQQVDNDIKIKMVEMLQTADKKLCSKRDGSVYGKPIFHVIPQGTR